MSRGHEFRKQIIEFVERWDGPFSITALVIFAAAGLLAHFGYDEGELAKNTAEDIDWALLGAGAVVGFLRYWNWHLRGSKPSTYEDPQGLFPNRDKSERGLAFLNPDGAFGFPKYRFYIPTRDDLDEFVEWSEEDPGIRDSNQNLQTYQRGLLYRTWYDVEPRSFLIMQSKSTVGAIWRTIGLSIMLQLPEQTYEELKNKQLGVIDFKREHLIYPAGERRGRYLLYDTLIFEETFRKRTTDFKSWHSIFHFSQFPAPKHDAIVTLLIEPDNRELEDGMKKGKYGPFTSFKTINGHTIYEFELPDASLYSSQGRRAITHWQTLRDSNFDIQIGS
jgi:hypothetical protein